MGKEYKEDQIPPEKDKTVRTFNTSINISDLKTAGITPLDIQKAGEDWDTFLMLIKILQISGEPITDKTPLNELTEIQKELNL